MVPTGQDTAGTTSKAPATRIGSLQGSVPPSRSASPSTRGRGSGTRGKRGTIKPSFTGRRSKEDREALEKQQKERDLLRNAERMAADEKKKKEELRAQKREANKLAKARGGYTGAMSGPFSLGSSREGQSRKPFQVSKMLTDRKRQEKQLQSRHDHLRVRVWFSGRTSK